MKSLLRGIITPVLIIVVLFSACNILLGFCSSRAVYAKDIVEPKVITLDEEGIAQLRLFKKEIARLQYSEFCSVVKKMPANVLATMKQIQAVAEKGDKDAVDFLNWVGPIVEKYKSVGCDDA